METITLYDGNGEPIVINEEDKEYYLELGFLEKQPKKKAKKEEAKVEEDKKEET